MMRLADRVAGAIARNARLVVAIVVLVTIPAALLASRVRIDSGGDGLLDRSAPETLFDRETKTLFGTEEWDIVLIVADDVYAPATLEKIRRLSDELAGVAGVEAVRSLSTVQVLRASSDGAIDASPVLTEVPSTPDAIEHLRRIVREDPLLAGTFVTDDGRTAAILVGYEPMLEVEFISRGIHDHVTAILRREQGPERIHVFGVPTMKAEAARLMSRDMAIFMPLTALVLVVVLFFAFRTLRGVLVPLATIGIGLIWTVGAMGGAGAPLDAVGLVLPSLLLAIGAAYSTHVVARFADQEAIGGDRTEIARRTILHVGLPVIVTGATTMAGFASLVVYRVASIQRLGVFLTFGIAALVVLALTFTASVLASLPARRARRAEAEREWPWLRRTLDSIVRFDVRHRRGILAAGALLAIVFAWRIPEVRVDTDTSKYFPEDSPASRARDEVEKRLGGGVSFLIVVDGPEPGSVVRLDPLRRIAALQDHVAKLPGIVAVDSIVDVVKVVHRALHDGDASRFTLPDSEGALAQELLLVPPEAVESFLASDGSRAAIHVRASIAGSRELRDAVERIDEFAKTTLPQGFSVRSTGTQILVARAADRLTEGQVRSVVVACAVIFIAMTLVFRSPRLALLAMVPNAIPVVVYFGVLGWTGVSLSMTTAIIASIALGLGVDEAIHLLAEFRGRLEEHGDVDRAVREAMSVVGPPVVFTSVALTAGFLVPALSSFVPIQQFAVFSALNVATSLLADLFLLPAALATVPLSGFRTATVSDAISHPPRPCPS